MTPTSLTAGRLRHALIAQRPGSPVEVQLATGELVTVVAVVARDKGVGVVLMLAPIEEPAPVAEAASC